MSAAQWKFVREIADRVIKENIDAIKATDIMEDIDALAATDLVFGKTLDEVDDRTTVDIPAAFISDVCYEAVGEIRIELVDEAEVARMEQDDSLFPPYGDEV